MVPFLVLGGRKAHAHSRTCPIMSTAAILKSPKLKTTRTTSEWMVYPRNRPRLSNHKELGCCHTQEHRGTQKQLSWVKENQLHTLYGSTKILPNANLSTWQKVIRIFLGPRVEGRGGRKEGPQRPGSSFGYVRHLDGVMVLVSTYIDTSKFIIWYISNMSFHISIKVQHSCF